MPAWFVAALLMVAAGTAPPVQAQSLAPSPGAQQYVEKAAIGNRFEIESSHLARSRSADGQVRAFADRMIREHGRLSERLRQALADAGPGLAPPPGLDAPHQEMIDKLREASGPEFDLRYLEMQLKTHREAVHLHSNYAADGDVPQLRKLAAEATPIVRDHLERLQQIGSR